MNKRLLVKAGSIANPVVANVEINGVLEAKKLTPKLARVAARIAFGHSNRVTVLDTESGYGYRLYKNSARKIYTEV